MHAVYALLLPAVRDPEIVLGWARDVIQDVIGGDNQYAFIGFVLPDGEIVQPDASSFTVSDRCNIYDLADEVGKDWLSFVKSLEYQEVASVLGMRPNDGTETIQRIVERDGKDAIIEMLAAVVANPAEGHRRIQAAWRLVVVLDDEWPFPEVVTSRDHQRVFKYPYVSLENVATVLVDVHT